MTGPAALPSAPPQGGTERSAGTVLIVDDEVFIRNAYQLYLETVGFSVLAAENGETALEISNEDAIDIDVVVLDLVMPGIQGTEVLRALKRKRPTVEVIIVTGCGNIGTAIEALRYGAFDYITKPIVNFDVDLLTVVEAAARKRRERLLSTAPRPGGPPAGAEADRARVLDRLVEVGALVNRQRPGEPVLEELEELLRGGFGVSAGILLYRRRSDFSPLYSWGFSGPLGAAGDRLPDGPVWSAVRDAAAACFPARALEPEALGIDPEDLRRFEEVACLPLPLLGVHWASLLLFFPDPLPAPFGGPPESTPFQVLGPLLASAFSGALRPVHDTAG